MGTRLALGEGTRARASSDLGERRRGGGEWEVEGRGVRREEGTGAGGGKEEVCGMADVLEEGVGEALHPVGRLGVHTRAAQTQGERDTD
jgi:hypothetical protein